MFASSCFHLVFWWSLWINSQIVCQYRKLQIWEPKLLCLSWQFTRHFKMIVLYEGNCRWNQNWPKDKPSKLCSCHIIIEHMKVFGTTLDLEHHTGIVEVMGLNPVEASFFSGLSLQLLKLLWGSLSLLFFIHTSFMSLFYITCTSSVPLLWSNSIKI